MKSAMFIVPKNGGILEYYKGITSPRKDFRAVKITERLQAMYGEAVCRATSQAVLKSC